VRVEAVVLRAPAIPSNYYKMPFGDGRAEEIKTETLSAPVYRSHRDSSPEREPWISPGAAAAIRRSPVAAAACPLQSRHNKKRCIACHEELYMRYYHLIRTNI
jgi:hypothetical protein